MKLYLTNISGVGLDDMQKISDERAKRVKRLKKHEDKLRCIASGLLIKKLVGDTKITTNQFGKPIAENGTEFNISHSGQYVLLATDTARVGCDIEMHKAVQAERLGKIVFCENEMQLIERSADKAGAFYDLWTKKESLLKCIGEGFHRNAKSVDVSGDSFSENGNMFYFKTYHFADYTVSVCSEKDDFPRSIDRVQSLEFRV